MFFDRLTLLCNENHTDISNVLRAIGLSTSKGTAWRNGSIPNGEILLKLSNYFHVSTDYLLGSSDNCAQRPALMNEDGLDEETKELREIWETASADERNALLEAARLFKNQRKK